MPNASFDIIRAGNLSENSVNLVSTTIDPEGDEISYLWESSLDGILSNESSWQGYLSRGSHVISLSVNDGRMEHINSTSIANEVLIVKNSPPKAVIHTPVSGTNSYTYTWDTSSGTLSDGAYFATVCGTDLIGIAYVAGTQSITFRVDSSTPTVTLTTSDPDNTIQPGQNITVTVTFNEPMASGPRITIGSAVNNVALTATNSTTFTYSWNTSGVSAGSYTCLLYTSPSPRDS